MKTVDTLLIGRKTYEVMTCQWSDFLPRRANNYVFTRTKKKSAAAEKETGNKGGIRTSRLSPKTRRKFVKEAKAQERQRHRHSLAGGELGEKVSSKQT